MKHVYGVMDCPYCEEKLKGVHHALADVYRSLIKPQFQTCHISDGWRGEDDQNKAFEEHRSTKKWPESQHNKLDDQGNPCSLAIDVFEQTATGVGMWPFAFFESIYRHLLASGVPIVWGGDWNHNGRTDDERFIDRPHFQWMGPV